MGLFDELKYALPADMRKKAAKPAVFAQSDNARKNVVKPKSLAEGEGTDVCVFGDADVHFANEIGDEGEHREANAFEPDDIIKHIIIGDVLNNPRFKR